MVMQPWLLLTYKIPPEPSKKRVAIWRRLKGMGAVYLQSGVCLLPKTDDHVRRLKMLENDITNMGFFAYPRKNHHSIFGVFCITPRKGIVR
jgi:hypothetical protein